MNTAQMPDRTTGTGAEAFSDIVGVVDLGGTKTTAGIVDRAGRVFGRKTVPTPHGGPDEVVATAMDLFEAVISGAGVRLSDLTGVGASLPGLVDRQSGVLDYWPVRGWRDIPIAAPFRARFGCRVDTINDVDGCALAEGRHGVAKGVSNFFWITVSTGVGGAVVLNDRLHRGDHGLAGEIGHVPVGVGAELCSCGRFGCLEASASGPSLVKKARRLGLSADDGRTVARLAEENDAIARFVMNQASEAIGNAIAVCANLLDIELFVLGGGVSDNLDLALAERVARAALIDADSRSLTIARTGLGANAALIGPAALLFSNGEQL